MNHFSTFYAFYEKRWQPMTIRTPHYKLQITVISSSCQRTLGQHTEHHTNMYTSNGELSLYFVASESDIRETLLVLMTLCSLIKFSFYNSTCSLYEALSATHDTTKKYESVSDCGHGGNPKQIPSVVTSQYLPFTVEFWIFFFLNGKRKSDIDSWKIINDFHSVFRSPADLNVRFQNFDL